MKYNNEHDYHIKFLKDLLKTTPKENHDIIKDIIETLTYNNDKNSIWGFYENEKPIYTDYDNAHELSEKITVEEVQSMADTIFDIEKQETRKIAEKLLYLSIEKHGDTLMDSQLDFVVDRCYMIAKRFVKKGVDK